MKNLSLAILPLATLALLAVSAQSTPNQGRALSRGVYAEEPTSNTPASHSLSSKPEDPVNGFAVSQSTGEAYCFGDSTGSICPCRRFGGPGEGCANTTGKGAKLSAHGQPVISQDSFSLVLEHAPPFKPGLFFQGGLQLSKPFGDGLLCTILTESHGISFTGASGTATLAGLGSSASAGLSIDYQFWYRDPGNKCTGAGYNLSNGWTTVWVP